MKKTLLFLIAILALGQCQTLTQILQGPQFGNFVKALAKPINETYYNGAYVYVFALSNEAVNATNNATIATDDYVVNSTTSLNLEDQEIFTTVSGKEIIIRSSSNNNESILVTLLNGHAKLLTSVNGTNTFVFSIDAPIPLKANRTVADNLLLNNETRVLAQILSSVPGVLEQLYNTTESTNSLFCPRDIAWTFMPPGVLITISNDVSYNGYGYFTAALFYWTHTGFFYTKYVPTNTSYEIDTQYSDVNQNPQNIIAYNDNNTFYYDDVQARAFQSDIDSTNGVLHVIDYFLMFPPHKYNRIYQLYYIFQNEFLRLLANFGLTPIYFATGEQEDMMTTFAPSDVAIAAANSTILSFSNETIAYILEYHFIPGNNAIFEIENSTFENDFTDWLRFNSYDGVFYVNGVRANRTDISSSNGNVNLLDGVLIPPSVAGTNKTILQYLKDNNFTTLVTTLETAGLNGTFDNAELNNPLNSYTLFAPTDNAFALLGNDIIQQLLNTSNPTNVSNLEKILTYHVITSDILYSAYFSTEKQVATLHEETLTVNPGASVVTAGLRTANVVKRDINLRNGVVYVIDAVLVPSDVDIVIPDPPTPTPTPTPDSPPTPTPTPDNTTTPTPTPLPTPTPRPPTTPTTPNPTPNNTPSPTPIPTTPTTSRIRCNVNIGNGNNSNADNLVATTCSADDDACQLAVGTINGEIFTKIYTCSTRAICNRPVATGNENIRGCCCYTDLCYGMNSVCGAATNIVAGFSFIFAIIALCLLI